MSLPVRTLVACAAALTAAACSRDSSDHGGAIPGAAQRGGLTVGLPDPLTDVAVTEARVPGRPLVVIDPGHGGRDPGAPGAASGVREKQLTLQVARELRARLARDGRVRVALTRDADRSLELDQRSDIARRLGADLFVSLHADSSTDTDARGASVYSLSEVASDVDAARMAAGQGTGAGRSAPAGSVPALLADLATRDSMNASADFALRLVGTAGRQVALRPEPHRFAAFRVLRRAEAPAVLVEMGYLSNAQDEAMLLDDRQRSRIVTALAQAIETELAIKAANR
ncbi:N-acetylmuramoyl-L-alanine amidase [Sphingomonas sp. BN140010]|uniref:N-acetylmuramoyl-L-alanine amidase n=1 Tax=Sphingomonas arvum TaxID=2992113 RepID=A0ABT3JGR0_9SPHN|nr:N-acetylmuramoyl-L-alanine amidase [Sphingomonas sp. BN140010]MCW3798273.1 N-acetylmuramoyl-L-alanine amidase [Sphingomonas sp. BN140010]